MSADREQRLARAYLLRVAEPPAPALVAFVAGEGAVAAARQVRAEQCPPAVAEETSARRGLMLAEQDLAAAERAGARLVVPEDEEWPAWPLLSMDLAMQRGITGVAAPLGLWVRGSAALNEVADAAVAVVGARAATSYGEHIAADLAHGLALGGTPVLSGAAYGIDGAAHRGALAGGGLTAAVLGCGLDVGYPAGHVGLLDRIAGQGLVISEYPLGTPPARHRFLVRNRLIAALSEGTVVVEAGRRSGARNTASTAGVLGKPVMAVPGPVTSGQSVGCHQLIRDLHATLVASVTDVAETVGGLSGEASAEGTGQASAGSCSQRSQSPQRPTDRLSPELLRVHEALVTRVGKSVEQIAAESGVPLARVRAALPSLELDGFSERCESGWRRARCAPSG